jgi:radical SAM superfamily enzyme YgiQ (UPF0313 family)
MAPLRVYLADLTHVGSGIATEAFPLNIGLIAAHAKNVFGDNVEIALFKYPQELREAIAARPPQVLGCSNYTWNSNLSYHFASWSKSIDRNIVTIFGGTNYPFSADRQQVFLAQRPNLDIHVYYEGEIAFSGILGRMLSVTHGAIFDQSLPGCQFIDRKTGQFITGQALPRIRELDAIPSPYVTGLLDKFFDGHLTPLVETARGCPFRCNFCNAGDTYFNKVNLFSDDYVREELSYIARRAAETGVGHVTFADNNFGMIPRDSRTAELLHTLHEKYQWPSSISMWTGKNSKERVIDVTRLLGDTLSISMSVQSMDGEVLRNIRRDNIKLDHYRKIAESLNEQGRPQHAEAIMPLPGETFRSHIDGLNELLDTNVSRVLSHTLQMLHGTPYKDDSAYCQAHGYVTKYRVVPLDFSHLDDEYVFDVEEVGVATNTLSFSEYVEARKYLLVIDLCYNSGVFDPLKKFLRSQNYRNSEWIQSIYNQLDGLSPDLKQVFASFEQETISELWDSEADLVAFYSRAENYEKLVNYEMGGNVLFKHRTLMLTKLNQEWVEAVFGSTEKSMLPRVAPDARAEFSRELSALKDYVLSTVYGCFSPQRIAETVERSFDYDLLSWLRAPGAAHISDFTSSAPLMLRFAFSDRAVAVMHDAFQRYGTDIAGLVKMIQRISGISFTRKVAYLQAASQIESAVAGGREYGPGLSSM